MPGSPRRLGVKCSWRYWWLRPQRSRECGDRRHGGRCVAPLETPAFWPVDALVALAMGAALVHAWDVLDAARSGVRDDDTWYLMDLPMQAGFALTVPVAAAVAVLALANGVAGWWLAILPPAGCAMWFGAVCAKNPELVGSLGELPGLFAAGWGIAVAVAL